MGYGKDLERRMKQEVLDHGYVEFIEAWGTGRDGQSKLVGELVLEDQTDPDYEVGIIEAARQSTAKGFQGWVGGPHDCDSPDADLGIHLPTCGLRRGDQKLLKYLYDHKHDTPFEFAGMVIEVQAPIFVFREWHRHRTQSYNEMSARYTPLPDLYYIPTSENIYERAQRARSPTTKQMASLAGIGPLERGDAEGARHAIAEAYADAERIYQHLLKRGVPKEIARVVMPVGHYSRMRASASLRNWLAFLTLRMDPNAQWEIRQFANAVGSIVEKYFPRTWELFHARQSQSI